jgi:hypothetical protein
MAQTPDPYVSAIHLMERSLQLMKPDQNPALSTLCNGLLQFAKALRQDLAEMKAKIDAIDSDVKSIR